MAKDTKFNILKTNMNSLMTSFLSKPSDERIKYIKKLESLSQIERIVLLQCKKYMTPQEKRVYNKTQKEASEKNKEQSEMQ